jgi:predicted ester cyclase
MADPPGSVDRVSRKPPSAPCLHSIERQPGKGFAMTDEHADDATRRLMTGFYEAFARRDAALLKEIVAPDWQYIPPIEGIPAGPGATIQAMIDMATAFPDMSVEIISLLIHGDSVGVRAHVSGTHLGKLMGIAPTSRKVSFAIHSFHEVHDGHITKTWHLEDWIGVFRQVGAYPPEMNDLPFAASAPDA